MKKHAIADGLSRSRVIPHLLGMSAVTYTAKRGRKYLSRQMSVNFLTYKSWIEKHGIRGAARLLLLDAMYDGFEGAQSENSPGADEIPEE